MADLDHAVAVIGIGCRFPGADDPRRFWHNLCAGVESIRFYSADELRKAGVAEETLDVPHFVPAHPALDAIEDFDAAFFGFTPREAEILDPQHRLLLECAWHALEDAGVVASDTPLNAGVYVGTAGSSYLQQNLLSHPDLIETMGPMAVLMANDKDFAAAQIAYRLDLTGPAVGIATACSSSLVAIHTATSALQAFECDLALAGGASVKAQQRDGYFYQEGGVLSPDGHCRPFSDQARGTVGGSGAALVLLKRLADALADGDPIYAVIAGSAVNNDGAAKLGMTAPSVGGQARVIREAMAIAAAAPDSIGYVEAHGTGTPLGDPVELSALAQAFGRPGAQRGRCLVGSVKSNVGHLDAAAGVAGFIKAALAVEAGCIPPTLHFERPNPKFDFMGSRFAVADRLHDWPAIPGPRRAGISSFGIGGTNAHVLLQQSPAPATRHLEATAWQVLLQSAGSDDALAAARERLAAHLDAARGTVLADVAHTLATGRRHYAVRSAVVCRDIGDAPQQLRSAAIRARGVGPARVVWLFGGHGDQFRGMAASIYRNLPVFRSTLDECAAAFRAEAGIDLQCFLYGTSDADAEALLSETAQAHAAVFSVQYALARWWNSCGHQPDLLLGHGLGEYVAATVAQVWSLSDAVRLVTARSRLISGLARGAMSVVTASAERVAALLDPGCVISADDGPERCVIGGDEASMASCELRLQAAGLVTRRLASAHVFHSPAVEPILDAFGAVVAQIRLQPSTVPMVSSLTGEIIDPEVFATPDYWVRHLRGTMNVRQAFAHIAALPERSLLLDLGPGGSMGALARHNGFSDAAVIGVLPGAPADDYPHCLAAAAQLWCEGVDIETAALCSRADSRRIRLPGYAFQRSRHWIEPAADIAGLHPQTKAGGPLYRHRWQRVDTVGHGEEPVASGGACLIVCDRGGLLRGFGDDASVVVELADAHRELGPRRYTLAAGASEGFDGLFAALARHEITLGSVLFGPGLDPMATASDLVERETLLARLADACARAQPSTPLRWRILLRDAFQVGGSDRVSAWHRALACAVMVLAQEMPDWECRLLDLGTHIDAAVLGRVVAADFGRRVTSDPQAVLALRGRQLWTLDVEAVPAPPARNATDPVAVIVTGGLGAVASALALEFAGRGARVLAVGRREAGLVTGDAAARLEQLQAAGIVYEAADVADADALRAAFARSAAGHVDLVIHAAADIGVDRLTTFADSDAAAFERQNRPKITGCLALRSALQERSVGKVVLMSSLSATLGGLGLGPYAGANGYFDGLADDAVDVPEGWYALAWDGLSPMPASPQDDRFGPAEIASLIIDVTARHSPGFYLMAKNDLAARLRHWQRRGVRRESTQLTRVGPPDGYVLPRSATETAVALAFESLIGVSPVGAQDHFFDLGGDSLLATQLCSRLRGEFAVDLPITAIFETPVVADLAARILGLTTAATLDDDELAGMLAQIDALSADQVQELLSS